MGAWVTDKPAFKITNPVDSETLTWDSSLRAFINSAGVTGDSLNVRVVISDSAEIDTLTATTGIIEATGSQNIFNFKPPATALDGDAFSWTFLVNDTLEVLKVGTISAGGSAVHENSTTVWIITQPHVSAYVATADTTVVPTAGSYKVLQAGITNKSVKGFSTDPTGITALIKRPRIFDIEGTLSCSVNSPNAIITMALQLDDGTTTSIIPGSAMQVKCQTSDDPYPVPIGTTVYLEEGDKVTIVVTTDGSGDIVNTADGYIKLSPL